MFENPVQRTSGSLTNEVYVWQRQWNTNVSDALLEASTEMNCFAVLAAEVSFDNGRIGQVAQVPVNYGILKESGNKVALVLRIGTYPEGFSNNPEITGLLSILAASLIEEARYSGIEPIELQVDYDCAESKLADYTELVKVVKNQISSVPIVITALPCWLNQGKFKTLLNETDGFVLQVHSLERPQSPDSPMMLCDTALSKKWVEKAAKYDVPFRVALPTYGYIVGFDENGRFLGIAAEGSEPSWPDGAILRNIDSDAAAIAGLGKQWKADRPANMQGLIWYRLPVKTDKLNWSWETLLLVMNGDIPQEDIEVEIQYPGEGLANIFLSNIGQIAVSSNMNITIKSQKALILAADGMNGFEYINNSAGGNFEFAKDNSISKIKPGQKLQIGWLRLNSRTEIQADVQ